VLVVYGLADVFWYPSTRVIVFGTQMATLRGKNQTNQDFGMVLAQYVMTFARQQDRAVCQVDHAWISWMFQIQILLQMDLCTTAKR
jgi:hypothetical protein